MHESSFCSRLFLLVAAPTTLEVVGDRWKSLCDSFVHQHQARAPGTPIEGSKLDSAGKSYLRAWGGGGPPPCMQEYFTRFHSAKALSVHMCGPCATAACMAAGLGSEEVPHV